MANYQQVYLVTFKGHIFIKIIEAYVVTFLCNNLSISQNRHNGIMTVSQQLETLNKGNEIKVKKSYSKRNTCEVIVSLLLSIAVLIIN